MSKKNNRRSRLNPTLSRRTVLQGLGLGACASLFPSLRPRVARADNTGSAKRIVFFVTSHGTVPENWRMRPNGQPNGNDWEFSLAGLGQNEMSPILAPLYGKRDKLLVLDGLANTIGRTAKFNEHEMGHASCLTGRLPIAVEGGLGRANGPSIDQIIAQHHAGSTPFASLEYAVGGWPVCFDQNGNALPYEENVWSAYDRLFPNGPQPPSNEPSDAQRIASAHPRMLDLVSSRYDQLSSRMSSTDRQKLEQHRDLLSSLGQSLHDLAQISCEAAEPPPTNRPEWGSAGYPLWHEDIFFDLTSIALSCGLSKVITIRHDTMFNSTVGAPAGDLHADFAHETESNPEAVTVMTNYHRHQAEAFNRLLNRLDAIPEGDGTVLDNTICVWHNELATGSHSLTNLPLVIAGGGGYFDLGRYVHWAPQDLLPAPFGGEDIPVGPAHNKLLTCFARAMGLEVNSTGANSVPRAGGGNIDLTDALDRVAI